MTALVVGLVALAWGLAAATVGRRMGRHLRDAQAALEGLARVERPEYAADVGRLHEQRLASAAAARARGLDDRDPTTLDVVRQTGLTPAPAAIVLFGIEVPIAQLVKYLGDQWSFFLWDGAAVAAQMRARGWAVADDDGLVETLHRMAEDRVPTIEARWPRWPPEDHPTKGGQD